MKKIFIDFLRRKGILTEFICNLSKTNPVTLSQYINKYKDHPHLFIWSAFEWFPTSEGNDFWINMADQWDNYLELLEREKKEKEMEDEELANLASSIPQY